MVSQAVQRRFELLLTVLTHRLVPNKVAPLLTGTRTAMLVITLASLLEVLRAPLQRHFELLRAVLQPKFAPVLRAAAHPEA